MIIIKPCDNNKSNRTTTTTTNRSLEGAAKPRDELAELPDREEGAEGPNQPRLQYSSISVYIVVSNIII